MDFKRETRPMEKKSRYVVIALGVIIALLIAGYAYTLLYRPTPLKRISIGTAAIGGGYYPIGVGVAQVISKYVPDVSAVAEATGGSIENMRLLSEGRISIGFSNNIIAMMAFRGEEPFEKSMKDLRALFVIGTADTYHNIVTLENSGINTIKDIKGKRISVGAPGSAANIMARLILKIHGVEPEDVTMAYLGWADAMTALKDGRIDVAYVLSAVPRSSAVYELSTTHRIKLVPVDPEAVERAVKEGWLFSVGYIKAGTYIGVDVDVPCAMTGSTAFVRADFPEDLAYQIVKAVNEHIPEIDRIAPGFKKSFKLITSPDFFIPVHPGAVKYAKELGVWKE